MMGVRSTVIGWGITAFIMACTWALMDIGAFQGFTNNFFGKLIVSFVIIILAKFLGKMFGG